jgi:hypothetical protein
MQLSTAFPTQDLPKLPPYGMTRDLRSKHLEERQQLLGAYLESLLAIRAVASSDGVAEFIAGVEQEAEGVSLNQYVACVV